MNMRSFGIVFFTHIALSTAIEISASQGTHGVPSGSQITIEAADSSLAPIRMRMDAATRTKEAALGLGYVASQPMKVLIDQHKKEQELHSHLRRLLVDGKGESFAKIFNALDPALQRTMATMIGPRLSDLEDSYLDNDEHAILTGNHTQEIDAKKAYELDRAIAQRDLKRRKLLHYATIFSYNYAVAPLLAAGANSSDKDYHEKLPLYYALKLGDFESASTLIGFMPNLLMPINEDKHVLAYLAATKEGSEEYFQAVQDCIRITFSQMRQKHTRQEVLTALNEAIKVADDYYIEDDLRQYKEELSQQPGQWDLKQAVSADKDSQPQMPAHQMQPTDMKKRLSKHERRERAALRTAQEEQERKKRLDAKDANHKKDEQPSASDAKEKAEDVSQQNLFPAASAPAALQRVDELAKYVAFSDDRELQKAIARQNALRCKVAGQKKSKKSKKLVHHADTGSAAQSQKEAAPDQKKEKKSRMEELDEQAHTALYKTIAQKVAEQDSEDEDFKRRGKAISAFFTSPEFAAYVRSEQALNRLKTEWQDHQEFLTSAIADVSINTDNNITAHFNT